jgi:hypothetical protein
MSVPAWKVENAQTYLSFLPADEPKPAGVKAALVYGGPYHEIAVKEEEEMKVFLDRRGVINVPKYKAAGELIGDINMEMLLRRRVIREAEEEDSGRRVSVLLWICVLVCI